MTIEQRSWVIVGLIVAGVIGCLLGRETGWLVFLGLAIWFLS